jgi:hypothetical protein
MEYIIAELKPAQRATESSNADWGTGYVALSK